MKPDSRALRAVAAPMKPVAPVRKMRFDDMFLCGMIICG